MADFLTAAEAARRLGVKPATLYAYVSRGVLSRGKAADGRASLFNADEVERLARRGRPGHVRSGHVRSGHLRSRASGSPSASGRGCATAGPAPR